MHRTHDRVETGAGGGGASKKTKRVSARGCTAAEHGTKSKPCLAPDGAFATLFRHLLVPERERVPLQRLGDVRSNGVSRLRRQRLVVARDGNGFRPRDRGEQLRDRLAVVTPAGFPFFTWRGIITGQLSSKKLSLRARGCEGLWQRNVPDCLGENMRDVDLAHFPATLLVVL